MDTKNVIAEKVYTLVGMCRGQGFGVSMQANSIGNDIINLLKEQEEKKKGQWIPIESPTGVEAFGIKEMIVMNVRCSVCGSLNQLEDNDETKCNVRNLCFSRI